MKACALARERAAGVPRRPANPMSTPRALTVELIFEWRALRRKKLQKMDKKVDLKNDTMGQGDYTLRIFWPQFTEFSGFMFS